MQVSQYVKARRFRALHERDGAFIIPNPWDVGSARVLARLGFEALATTSAGYAFSTGQRDRAIARDAMLAHVAAIASASDLPVSADLEDGYAADLAGIEETFLQVASAGAVGASIEDASHDPHQPLLDAQLAAERVRAAAEAVHALPFPFTLTARAENFLVGRTDLKDTIARLQMYQDAGADVLYAPGLVDSNDIATVVRAVDRPVNVVMGLGRSRLSRWSLAALGVKRVSVGSALFRAAFGAFIRAAREMREDGTFGFANEAIGYSEISMMFDADNEVVS